MYIHASLYLNLNLHRNNPSISTKFTVIIGVIVFANILIINHEITNRHLTPTYFYALFFYRTHVKAVKNCTFAVAKL